VFILQQISVNCYISNDLSRILDYKHLVTLSNL